ncbi:hypothetical protein J8L98_17665 [Pseudoalteromonas sp. MMG013]|uniref:hypothetical protein n=1 Tax=Pseudoalteromonas sp. MMG013 TaxID=2822687 RepID=UPI001B358CC6|nr:hypothetical protein [Pseudoalteromonas sp. MMG013]MBQ4863513.1 hypothetical protein [Pseudoalteromonas sp. MMG013]
MLNFLFKGAKQGDEELAIYYGYALIDLYSKDRAKLLSGIDKLKEFQLVEHKKDFLYLMAIFYGDDDLGLFSAQKRDYYLKEAYKAGHDYAGEMIKEMERLEKESVE